MNKNWEYNKITLSSIFKDNFLQDMHFSCYTFQIILVQFLFHFDSLRSVLHVFQFDFFLFCLAFKQSHMVHHWVVLVSVGKGILAYYFSPLVFGTRSCTLYSGLSSHIFQIIVVYFFFWLLGQLHHAGASFLWALSFNPFIQFSQSI